MPKHVSLLKTRLKLSSRRRLKLWHFKIRLGDSVSGKVRFLCPIPIQFRPPRSSSDRQREFFPQLFVFKVLTEAFLLISPQQDRTLAGRELLPRTDPITKMFGMVLCFTEKILCGYFISFTMGNKIWANDVTTTYLLPWTYPITKFFGMVLCFTEKFLCGYLISFTMGNKIWANDVTTTTYFLPWTDPLTKF